MRPLRCAECGVAPSEIAASHIFEKRERRIVGMHVHSARRAWRLLRIAADAALHTTPLFTERDSGTLAAAGGSYEKKVTVPGVGVFVL